MSWTAKPQGEGYWNREWVQIVNRPPNEDEIVARVRAWDLAATEVSEANRDPDWTAGVKMCRTRDGKYYIEDVYRFRKSANEVIEEIIKTAKADGIDDCVVTIPLDGSAGGKAANAFHMSRLSEAGIIAKSIKTSGHQSKLNRFLPFAQIAENGNVCVVKGDWNEEYFVELENFVPNKRTQKDDMLDSTADAFNYISRSLQIPNFLIPNMSIASIKDRLR